LGGSGCLSARRNADDYLFVEPDAILMHRAGSRLERRRARDAGDRTFWFGVHPDSFIDALTRFGLSQTLYFLELAGVIVIFVGFLRSQEIFGLFRIPFSQGFRRVSEQSKHAA